MIVDATVALEEVSFTVNEDVGTVEVCANVTSPVVPCPVEFEFDVTFSVTDMTRTQCYIHVFM